MYCSSYFVNFLQQLLCTGRHYSFSQSDGSVIAELDMRLRREEWEALYGRHRTKRMTNKNTDKLWPNRTIPYRISSIFFEDQRRMIKDSMGVWANNTCLEFRKKTRRDRNYVVFTNGLLGCTSAVGMEGGQQRIDLATACLKKEIIIHEVGHTIGLYHEHSRPDRDNYISINTSNVDSQYINQFNKASWDNVTVHDVSYDLRSVMHYGKLYFSINGKPTVIPKDLTFMDIIGKSEGPSFGDIKTVNVMYKCNGHCRRKTCPCNAFMGQDCECMCPGDQTTGPPVIRCIDVTQGPCLLGALQENIKNVQEALKTEQKTVIGLKQDLLKSKQEAQLQLSQMKSTQNQLQSTQNQLQNEMNKVRSLTAFHVYMDKGGSIYPDNGDVIPFNRVITNIGDGFSTTTHKFRCAVSGVYSFWLTMDTGYLPSNHKRWTSGDLIIDNTRLSKAHCKIEGSDSVRMMCSNQAVTECQTGSQVWVRCGYRDVTMHGGTGRETTFSGFLLKQN